MHARKGLLTIGFELIIGVFLILTFLWIITALIQGLWQPQMQTALATANALALKIDEACGSTAGYEAQLDINLPQTTPPSLRSLLTNVFPRIYMRVNGDPRFLLYYENFPPGEAITWEIYNDYPARAVVFAEPQLQETLGEYLVRFRQELQAADFEEDLSRYAFGNIILRNRPAKGEPRLTGDIGGWDGNFYKFEKIPDIANMEHSLVKYRACGAYALCLKTREGIYRFPLERCRAKGIKVMLVEHKISRPVPEGAAEYTRSTVIGGVVGTVIGAAAGAILTAWSGPGALFTADIGAKIGFWVGSGFGLLKEFLEGWIKAKQLSNFYLASPCKANVIISKETCECKNPIRFKVLTKWFIDEWTGKDFNLYSIEGGGFSPKGGGNLCLFNYLLDENQQSRKLDQECVKITVAEDYKTFCTGGNRLNQVTLSTTWLEEVNGNPMEKGVAALIPMKNFREGITTSILAFGGLRIPFGWPS